jgi:hypothetical protein
MVGNVEAIWIDYIIFMSLGTISCAGNLSEKPRPVSSAIKIFCRWEHVFCRWEPVFQVGNFIPFSDVPKNCYYPTFVMWDRQPKAFWMISRVHAVKPTRQGAMLG